MKSTISELWEQLFDDYDILNVIKKNGYFIISADQIRTYKEPRLMAKFDNSRQLPRVFKDNKLGILPIKNGEYIIGEFKLFQNLSSVNYEDIEVKNMELPHFIETIDPDNIYSENNALNVALLSGMMIDAFGEELVETIQGKMRTNNFKFSICSDSGKEKEIEVNGTAIEIDGGYEGRSKVVLIEAKNTMPEDFIIRQLYYPYRHWKDRVLKNVIPAFLAYENGIYTLFIYSFDNDYNYNSLRLVKVKRYMISNKSSESIKKAIYDSSKFFPELPQSEVPFPQADSFSKVLAVLNLIDSDYRTANDIAENMDFDSRQGKYYIDALRYLGLVKKSKKVGEYCLTENGFVLCSVDVRKRNELMIGYILKHRIFYETYEYYLKNGVLPPKSFIANMMINDFPEMSLDTINRRASTVRGWTQWVVGCQV